MPHHDDVSRFSACRAYHVDDVPQALSKLHRKGLIRLHLDAAIYRRELARDRNKSAACGGHAPGKSGRSLPPSRLNNFKMRHWDLPRNLKKVSSFCWTSNNLFSQEVMSSHQL
jgi:hypothetical protein